jgi:hypothetical protein
MQKQTRQQSLQIVGTESETQRTAFAPHVFANKTYLAMNVCTQIHIAAQYCLALHHDLPISL